MISAIKSNPGVAGVLILEYCQECKLELNVSWGWTVHSYLSTNTCCIYYYQPQQTGNVPFIQTPTCNWEELLRSSVFFRGLVLRVSSRIPQSGHSHISSSCRRRQPAGQSAQAVPKAEASDEASPQPISFS